MDQKLILCRFFINVNRHSAGRQGDRIGIGSDPGSSILCRSHVEYFGVATAIENEFGGGVIRFDDLAKQPK